MTSIEFASATELAEYIKRKQISPVELTTSLIRRTERVEPVIHSYITFLPEIALNQAKKAEKELSQGIYRGPLHGIPFGIKDNFYTKGILTTSGSKMLKNFVPDVDATTVTKLKRAGTVMTGKLNLHEFTVGLTNINPFYGSSRNPWNLNHMTGGSSGGSAAAVAAGLVPIATGTDTFGSIRGPAAMCGIYGLKPTFGLVSSHGVTPLTWSLDHIGPMARSVSDIALMLNVMAGFDPKDPGSILAEIPDYTENLHKGITGLKIGISRYFLRGLYPDVERSFKAALLKMEDLGAYIIELDIPELEMATFAAYAILAAETANIHHDMLIGNPQGFGQDVRVFLQVGEITSTQWYIQSQQARRQLIESFKAVFENVDVVAAPSLPITAPRFQTNWVQQNIDTVTRCMPFTAPASLTGLPGLSFPIGMSQEQLPIGMQIIGSHLSEKLLLQIGAAWEQTNPLEGKRPII
jgi:aspartyl-tRNA(Asn)/glutamyl-tRNA(Gln) amidotransferase subunit A